jgi:hypothetical protein
MDDLLEMPTTALRAEAKAQSLVREQDGRVSLIRWLAPFTTDQTSTGNRKWTPANHAETPPSRYTTPSPSTSDPTARPASTTPTTRQEGDPFTMQDLQRMTKADLQAEYTERGGFKPGKKRYELVDSLMPKACNYTPHKAPSGPARHKTKRHLHALPRDTSETTDQDTTQQATPGPAKRQRTTTPTPSTPPQAPLSNTSAAEDTDPTKNNLPGTLDEAFPPDNSRTSSPPDMIPIDILASAHETGARLNRATREPDDPRLQLSPEARARYQTLRSTLRTAASWVHGHDLLGAIRTLRKCGHMITSELQEYATRAEQSKLPLTAARRHRQAAATPNVIQGIENWTVLNIPPEIRTKRINMAIWAILQPPPPATTTQPEAAHGTPPTAPTPTYTPAPQPPATNPYATGTGTPSALHTPQHQQHAHPSHAEEKTPHNLAHREHSVNGKPRRTIGFVIPNAAAIIGENVPGARVFDAMCFTCGEVAHNAASCPLVAADKIGAPFPGWTADGKKIPSHWTSPSTISHKCAQEWLNYLRYFNITGTLCTSGYSPPLFAHVF